MRLPDARRVLREDLSINVRELPQGDDSVQLSPWAVVSRIRKANYQRQVQNILDDGGGETSQVVKLVSNPSDFGPYVNTGKPLWLTFTRQDAVQKIVANCYFVSIIGELCQRRPSEIALLCQMFDTKTAEVHFWRSGVRTRVRTSMELPAAVAVAATDDVGALIMEKAYAFYRTGANTYASLGWGSPSAVLRDLGYSAASTSVSSTSISTVIAANNTKGVPMTANTKSAVTDGRLTASHVYGVEFFDPNTQEVGLRNPWGSSLRIPLAVFQANYNALSYPTGRVEPLPTKNVVITTTRVQSLVGLANTWRAKVVAAGKTVPPVASSTTLSGKVNNVVKQIETMKGLV
jgi:hypothetical protein